MCTGYFGTVNYSYGSSSGFASGGSASGGSASGVSVPASSSGGHAYGGSSLLCRLSWLVSIPAMRLWRLTPEGLRIMAKFS